MTRALAIGLPAFALLAFVAATCTFPEVTLSSGGAGGAAATSTLPGGAGGETLTTTSSSSTTTSGSGGTTTTSDTTTSGSGGTTTSATCPIDMDGDGAVSWKCLANGGDCGDSDVNAKPGIMEYSQIPIQNEIAPNTDPYDKNCDGDVETETSVLDCGLFCSGGNVQGYKAPVACGQSGALGHCGGIPCSWQAENPAKSKTQRCR